MIVDIAHLQIVPDILFLMVALYRLFRRSFRSLFQRTGRSFPSVDSLLSIDREPHCFAGLLPSADTRHYGADLKTVLMPEFGLVLAKTFTPDLYVRYVISSSDVTAAI